MMAHVVTVIGASRRGRRTVRRRGRGAARRTAARRRGRRLLLTLALALLFVRTLTTLARLRDRAHRLGVRLLDRERLHGWESQRECGAEKKCFLDSRVHRLPLYPERVGRCPDT